MVEGGHERAAGKGGEGAGCMRETDKMQHCSGQPPLVPLSLS